MTQHGRLSTTAANEVLPKMPALDGLHGVAVAMVLAIHLFWANSESANKLANVFVRVFMTGWVGIDLFCVLTAFLVTGILFDSLGDAHYFRNFYGRRALRILPLYYLTVAGVFLLYPETTGDGLRNLALLAFFLDNTPLWFHLSHGAPPTGILLHLWSLATGVQFYVVWPAIVFLVRDRRALLWIAAAGIVGTPVLRFVLFAHGVPAVNLYHWSVTRMDTLLVGASLALLLRGPARERVMRSAAYVFWSAAAVCLWIGVSNHGFDRDVIAVIHYGYSAVAFGFAALLAMALRAGSVAERWLSAGWIRFMGKYSYGLFLLHPLVLTMVEIKIVPALHEHVHSLVVFHLLVALITLLLVIPAAMLAFTLVEMPFLRLKRYLRYERGRGDGFLGTGDEMVAPVEIAARS
jgi:peptidoglycan/LPS O-acetylase OafA/YrhL